MAPRRSKRSKVADDGSVAALIRLVDDEIRDGSDEERTREEKEQAEAAVARQTAIVARCTEKIDTIEKSRGELWEFALRSEGFESLDVMVVLIKGSSQADGAKNKGEAVSRALKAIFLYGAARSRGFQSDKDGEWEGLDWKERVEFARVGVIKKWPRGFANNSTLDFTRRQRKRGRHSDQFVPKKVMEACQRTIKNFNGRLSYHGCGASSGRALE